MNRSSQMKKVAFGVLMAIGLMQMLGEFFHFEKLKEWGAMSGASPLPITYSDDQGIESFASDWMVTFTARNSDTMILAITPQLYAQVKGPSVRREAYRDVLTRAPYLPEKTWKNVLKNGFCHGGVLAEELDLILPVSEFVLHGETKTSGRKDSWEMKVRCDS